MKQSDPLTPAEIAVFGADARRRPDGSIEERGIKWSGSSPEAVAAAQPEQWPPAPTPAPSPPAASAQRTIDPRLVHPWPDMKQ